MDAAQAFGDQAPLTAGQVLDGKYRVGRELGGGAMGLVYEAYHPLLQKAVAIKVLRPELATVAEVRDRFEAEARATAAIGHQNIVSVTDMGQTPTGALYFVMDRLRGETLGERLEREGKLAVEDASLIVLDVLAGLEAAHALALVHRDMKPDNIFLTKPPAGREIAKILDFGIAKALASLGKRKTGTRLGFTAGTPAYMAPEQATGAPDIDARADLWAVGVTLYQALGGRLPFGADGDDAAQILMSVISGSPPPSLARLCDGVPPALVRLVDSALSRPREGRPQTAGEFAARLQEAVFGSSTPAPVQYKRTKSSPALSLDGLKALESGVLVDLAGPQPGLPSTSQGRPVSSNRYEPPPDGPTPLPVIELQRPIAVAGTGTIHPEEMASDEITRSEQSRSSRKPFPWRTVVRGAIWAIVVPLVGAAVVLAIPKLRGGAATIVQKANLGKFGVPKAGAGAPAQSAPKGDLAEIRFNVTPSDSKLYIDGQPLSSNPIALGKGEVHTVTAIADGYEIKVLPFSVGAAQTVYIRLERKSRR